MKLIVQRVPNSICGKICKHSISCAIPEKQFYDEKRVEDPLEKLAEMQFPYYLTGQKTPTRIFISTRIFYSSPQFSTRRPKIAK